MTRPSRRPRAPVGVGLGLLGCLALAVAARTLGFEQVFLDDGTVVFAMGDAFYHARRALYSFVNFPALLTFDPCINHPDGALVPHPPLLDWAVAGLGRLVTDDVSAFERFSAWLPAVFGALGVLPVYAVGASVGSRGVGCGAAAFYAVLPIATLYSQVGNVDHHAAAGLLGAVLLAGYVTVLRDAASTRRLALGFALLFAARTAAVLVWNGSLLYVVPGELAVVLCGALRRQPRLLAGEALSCAASAAVLAPVVALTPDPNGGAFSTTELSWFHAGALSAGALVCVLLAAAERVRPSGSPLAGATRLAMVGAAVAAGALLLSPLREGLAGGLGFLGRSDGYTEHVVEQQSLFFEAGRRTLAAGEQRMGYLAYLIPLVPLAFLLGAPLREQRAVRLLLFGWTLFFGLLALQQMRYANDYAAAGCVGAALLLAHARRWGVDRGLPPLAASALAVAGGVLLMAPTVPRWYLPRSDLTQRYLAGEFEGVDRALLSIGGAQVRFAEAVRRVTPEDAACGNGDARPAYGVVTQPALGHVLHYAGRRATPADPFGPYIGRENFQANVRLLETPSEVEAVSLSERLETPFLATAEIGGKGVPPTVAGRLQRADGSAGPGRAHLGRFRLVTEGPAGGIPLSAVTTGEFAGVPYKLFERVEGALLEVPAPPGTRVVARVVVETPLGRRFAWRAAGAAAADGVARLRVPYATEAEGAVDGRARTLGAYRIRAGGRRFAAGVSERAVRIGAPVRARPLSSPPG